MCGRVMSCVGVIVLLALAGSAGRTKEAMLAAKERAGCVYSRAGLLRGTRTTMYMGRPVGRAAGSGSAVGQPGSQEQTSRRRDFSQLSLQTTRLCHGQHALTLTPCLLVGRAQVRVKTW